MSEENKEIQTSTQKTETSSYRSIFKATSLFGGVQVWKILITIVQTKFVALILGPTGMGIKGLYSSATSLIQSVTAMGLSNSAVRDVSEANGTGDEMKVSRTVAVLRKLVWFTGLLGMVSVVALSPVLSKTTFGDYSYTIPFIILSVTLLLAQLTAGQNVILQGTRRLRYLAKAGIIGSVISLIITVPFYYFWGVKGIVPTMVLEAMSLLILAWYYSRKVKVQPVKVSLKEALHEGRGMMTLGLVMTYNSVLVLGCAYIVRVFITRTAGIGEVGLYSAGFAVVNTYVGLVFSAMSTDYYPRLAAVNTDNEACTRLANQQMEVSLLIIGPLMLVFLLVIPGLVIVLYSEKFLPIVGLMKWAALGVVFRAISWAIAYQIIAKGDKIIFAINETSITIISLVLKIWMYSLWGLTGMGIATMLTYFIYTLIVFFVAYRRYGYTFSSGSASLIVMQLLCIVPVFLLVYMWNSWWAYLLSALIMLAGFYYSYRELNKRMQLNEALRQVILKFRRK